MALNSFEATQGTQTALLTDNTGGTAGTLIPVMKIDVSPYGTAGTVWQGGVTGTINNGSIVVTAGTIASDTVVGGTLNAGTFTPNGGTIGTVQLVTAIGTIGTLGLGTITGNLGTIGTLGLGSVVVNTLPNVPGGTLNLVSAIGTIGTLGLGTITGNLGTIGTLGLGTITGNLGTIGTLGLGTITGNLGTLGTIGTIQNVGSVTNLGQVYNAGTIQAGTITQLNSGTVNVGTVGTIGLGTIVNQFLESSGSQTAGTATIISSFDVSSYRFLSLQLKNTFTGTVNVQVSNDNSNFVTLPVTDITNTTTGLISNLNATGIYSAPINTRFLKVVSGAWTSGTAQAVLETYSLPDLDRAVNVQGTVSVVETGGTFNAGTINVGTINTGTINNGSIVVTAGTVAAGTINTGTINTGTFVMTSGTLNVGTAVMPSGTLNVGTINTGTVNLGSIVKVTPAATAGSFTAAGTITTAGSQSDLSYYDIQGTWVGTVFFEGQIGTSSWFGVNAITPTGGLGTQTTTNGDYMVSMAGLDGVRARLTYSSGTLNYNNRTSNFFAPLGYSLGGSIGNVGILNAGTISTLPNLPQGSINVTAGTISTGTINTGTVNTGTFVGKDANGVVQTGNPIAIAGTNSGGSILTLQVDSSGNLKTTGVANGTTVGTINVGTINTGTINTGTINTGTFNQLSGTLNVGTINTGTFNLGSVVKSTPAAAAGSFTAAGTITVAGSQLDYAGFDVGGTWVGTVFTEGQIGTSGWFAVPYITPLGVYGTSFTGNGDYFVSMAGLDGVRARLTYSSGTLDYNARQSNFFAPLQYVLGGTIGNVGMLNAGTISSLPNLPQGSINVTAGTVSAGTINVGTITTGTINTGTFRGDARTTQNIITFGTQVAFTGAAAATIVGSSSVGAGTYLWMNDMSLINDKSGDGTFILGFGTTQQGTMVLFRGALGTSGAVGIEKTWPKATNAGMTNQDLVLSATGAGTVELTISYFISA